MITPELVQFIKGELAKETSREIITNKLKTQGWTDIDIFEAFSSIAKTIDSAPSVVQNPSAFTTNFATSGQPKSRKILPKVLLTIVILIILAGSGALAYAFGYITPLEKVFSQSIKVSNTSTGFTINMDATIDISGMNLPKEAIGSPIASVSTINASGSYDITDKRDPKFNSSLSIKSGTFEMALDARAINKSLYLKLTKAPDLGFFSLKPFENKWAIVPINTDELSNNPLADSYGINKNLPKDLTDEQKNHIREITEKASLIKITKKHLPEMMNGKLAFHFDFDLDHPGIIAYAKELVTYIESINKDMGEFPVIPEDDYNKIFDSIKDFHGEAWIGMTDHLPHKISASLGISNPDKPEDGVAKLAFNLNYSDWNKPVIVEVPKDATNIKDLIASVMGSMGIPQISPDNTSPVINADPLEAARIKATIDKIKSVHMNMRAEAEIFYSNHNGSYKGFCTAKTPDGGITQAKQLPKNTIYKCNDSTAAWASWSKLSTGEYFCVDSMGATKNVKNTPRGTSCGM